MRLAPKQLFAPLTAIFVAFAGPAQAVEVVELVAERASAEFGLALPERGTFEIRIAEGGVREGEFIRDFWIDKSSGQFIANVVTGTGDVRRVWGAAILTVPVPVPTRKMLPGEIVTEADISEVSLPYARLNAFAITDYADLRGKQVRRLLAPGRPVQRQSVIPPLIVLRGDRVKIKLSNGALQLTAAGKALTDAAEGHDVRVVNLSSNKTIIAVAKADGVVEVIQ